VGGDNGWGGRGRAHCGCAVGSPPSVSTFPGPWENLPVKVLIFSPQCSAVFGLMTMTASFSSDYNLSDLGTQLRHLWTYSVLPLPLSLLPQVTHGAGCHLLSEPDSMTIEETAGLNLTSAFGQVTCPLWSQLPHL
jgi:hypothetical protein